MNSLQPPPDPLIEIRPHRWQDQTGQHSADCYPFIRGNPVPAIAGCEHCRNFVSPEETCLGWSAEPENAPLFCGPICPRFDLVAEKRELLWQALGITENHHSLQS